MKVQTRKLFIRIVVGLLLVAGITAWSVLRKMQRMHRDSATFEFRYGALQEIARLTSDPQWVTNQIEQMAVKTERNADWFSGNVLLLKSGEWLVYANKCAKEDLNIKDTFVARASDGKWYHSTNHFYVGMVVLLMEGQPQDLATMVTQYHMVSIPAPNAP